MATSKIFSDVIGGKGVTYSRFKIISIKDHMSRITDKGDACIGKQKIRVYFLLIKSFFICANSSSVIIPSDLRLASFDISSAMELFD